MIKNKVSIERQINERLYQFIVPSDASLSECLAIVNDVREYILSRIKEVEDGNNKSVEKPSDDLPEVVD